MAFFTKNRFLASPSLGSLLIWAWGLFFLKIAFGESSATLYRLDNYFIIAVIGWAIGLVFFGSQLIRLLKNYSEIWLSVLGLSLWILISEEFGKKYFGNPADTKAGFQAGLILCWPILTISFLQPNFKKLFFIFLTLVSIWHYFAIPVEAFYGHRFTWHPFLLKPGGFNFQAAGLAFSRVYFAGFYIPLFFMALGTLATGETFKNFKMNKWWVSILCFLWMFPAVCSSSRSGMVGAVLGGLVLCFFFFNRALFLAASLSFIGALGLFFREIPIFQYSLFAHYSNDISARFQTIVLYLEKTFFWPTILMGHGTHFDRLTGGFYDPPSVGHSHNDFVEIFFLWGLPALFLYLVIWFQVVKLSFTNFKKHNYFWPFAVMVALLPNIISDLGFNHFEKANLLGFLLCLTILKHQQNQNPHQ